MMNSSPNLSTAQPLHRSTLRLFSERKITLTLWATVAAFCLLLTLAGAALWANVRQKSFQDGQEQVLHFVAGAQASVNRTLLGLDLLLASTADIVGLPSMAGDWNPSTSDSAEKSAQLRSAAKQNLLPHYVALLDAQGRTLASSTPAGAQLTPHLPPGFFQHVLQQPLPALEISAPSTSNAERVLYLARLLYAPNGSRLVALAQIPIEQLTPVLMQNVDIPGLEVTLERSNGELLLAYPTLPHRPPAHAQPHQQPSVHWEQKAHLSQQDALVVVQPTMYPSLWITASLPTSAALQPTRAERHSVLWAAFLLIAMTLLCGVLAHIHTQRMHSVRQALAQAKGTLDQALQSMVSGFLLLDAAHCVLQWNRRYLELFPWLQSDLHVGMPFSTLLEITVRNHLPHSNTAERNAWLQWRMQQLHQPEGHSFEHRLPSGQHVQITERPTPDGLRVITYHDVTALRRANLEIESLAFYDALTGLPNRRLLLDRLGQAIGQTQCSGDRGALLFVDLDKFKTLNDTRGHEVGDQLLQLAAKRLQHSVRSGDTVARLGGDEFVIMLCDLSPETEVATAQARHIGDKLLRDMAQPYDLVGQQYRCTCSIGAALYGSEPLSAIELLRRADIAMYQVKKTLRGNTLCFFDPQMQENINQRARLETDLQTALGEGQFELFYQPQFTLTGRMVGAEALLRWRHPLRGIVSPGEFIGVAEDSGLIVPIGLWVLQQACAQLAAWSAAPGCASLQLSVNVSARQFRESHFAEQVVHLLQTSGAPAHQLKLELTESLVLENVQEAIVKMHDLRTKGVRFSMDDFGTGHSSLAYLTQLPLDQLKIDQSFVRHIGERATDDVIVQTIIGMARTLDLEVIAEGVETLAQRDYLATHGCHLYQGYYFGKPVALADFHALLLGQPHLPPSNAPQRRDVTTMPATMSANAKA